MRLSFCLHLSDFNKSKTVLDAEGNEKKIKVRDGHAIQMANAKDFFYVIEFLVSVF